MSRQRYLSAPAYMPIRKRPTGPAGRPLCRWCVKVEVVSPRLQFCSIACRHEFRLRTDAKYARAQVYHRDRGVCSVCGWDTALFLEELAAVGRDAAVGLLAALGLPDRKSYWEVHHLTAVHDGGGACGLDNLATVCIACHKSISAAQTSDRARRRSLARTNS